MTTMRMKMTMKMVVTMKMLMMDRCEKNGLYERWRSTEEVDVRVKIGIISDVKRGHYLGEN